MLRQQERNTSGKSGARSSSPNRTSHVKVVTDEKERKGSMTKASISLWGAGVGSSMTRERTIESRTEMLLRLGFVTVSTIVLMSTYEYVKQVVILAQGIKQTHVLTILFSGFAAAVAAYFVLKKYDRMNHQLRCRISDYNCFDPLTGLPKRGLLKDRLNLIMAQYRRERRQVAVLSIDIDRFKWINDTMGHAAGDMALQVVAGRLQSRLRASDTVSRPGSDEFVVILSAVKHEQDIAHATQDIINVLSMPMELEGREIFVTASIGIAIFPLDGRNADDLLRNADTAMCVAKETGRNNYKFFSLEMNARAVERMTLETNLRRAMERNEFSLNYQPQVDVATGRIIGVEALLGWNSPEAGAVPPEKFIPIAEETGLIIPIGEWALREACVEAMSWQITGLPAVRVAVNISGCQFRRADLAATVARILRGTGLDPSLLEIELTESVLLENSGTAQSILEDLKSLGVRLTMDDFGTGYSSLTYLKHFPIDRLKIDKLFIRDINTSSDGASIVEAVIAMARSLGLEVMAEGVETVEQAEYLKSRNCFEMQGFYFSRPVGAETMRRQLETGLETGIHEDCQDRNIIHENSAWVEL
ncbi:MAG TPA: EAL domain-containing protein [Geobacteraceae bacterium]|nr:EAL domain-containing protein [Geobacteraceae bacterium]